MGLDLSRRKEGIQRIQVGLAGLTGVVLLIGLANIVVDSVKRNDPTSEVAIAANAGVADANADKPSEPLAELGVAPSTDSGDQPPPVVADLQPDPNLRQPMDRPPPVAPTVVPQQQPAQPRQ